jgi:NUMOD3 motif
LAIVYRHIRLDNGLPFYIGIGINEKRAYSTRDRSCFWKRIVDKCGYEVEILFEDISYEMAIIKEIEFILLYGRKDLKSGILCNMTNGGEGLNGYKFTDERKKYLSKKYSGISNPFYGKKHSPETINKFKYIAKNRTEETYKKISISNSNKIMPKETKLKISLATIGEKNHFYGKKHSKETKLIMSKMRLGKNIKEDVKFKMSLNQPKSKKICKIIDGKLIEYTSIRDASKKSGINRNRLNKNFEKYGFFSK